MILYTIKLTHNVNADSQSNEGIPKEKSIPSDGFDMKHSMVYKNKLSQIEMLKKQQGYKGLIPAKKEIGTRFILTNLHIDLINADIRCYILEHFKSVINV